MLIQFNFSNFKSFKNEVSLDLSATKITEFSDRVISIGNDKVLPVAAIFGANASGKSNVYNAFEYMSNYVIHSFKYGDESELYKGLRPDPFRFSSDTEKAETSFEVYFTIPGDESGRTYNYGFCIDDDGISEEWLNDKARTARKYRSVFYRDRESHDFSGLPKESRDNIETALEKQVLIVSLGAKLRVAKCKLIRDWFLNNEFADFGNPVTTFFMHRTLPEGFVDDPKVRENVVQYFSSFDETIKDFRVEKLPSDANNENEELYRITALHKRIDGDGFAEIPLEEESAGTLKMFALYPELQAVLKNGGVYFIDELNARLHPLLVRNFILTFLNPKINVNHAQLVFTTHDTWQLSNQLLRRDEVWFTEKDSDGISTFYSLADFIDDEGNRIRKDESYEKNYLIGKYGAIPTLKSICLWGDN